MRKKIILFAICIKHGINPFGRLANNIDAMKQKLTDEEKERLIDLAESEVNKRFWRSWLYEKGGAE